MFSCTGFFHFVFANINDEYYTPSLIRMNFYTYLWYRLTKDKYKSFAILKKISVGSGYLMELTGMNEEQFGGFKKKNKLFKGFFSSKQEEDVQSPYDTSVFRRVIRIKTNEEMLQLTDSIINLMQEGNNIALAMEIDDFCLYCSDEKKRKLLGALRKNNRSNAVILYSGVDAAENDPYFIRNSTSPSVFFDKQIFPEIERAFNPGDTERIRKLVFTYEVLKSALGDNMHVWNRFTQERLIQVIRYVSLRSDSYAKMVSPDLIAAIIRIWYGNQSFQEKYKGSSPLSESINPRRMITDIANIVIKKKFFLWIEEVCSREKTDHAETLLHRWLIHDSYPYIGYFSEGYMPPEIVHHITRFYTLVLSHRYHLGEDKLLRLSAVASRFSEPCFQSSYVKASLPHKSFEEASCSSLVNELIVKLSVKQEWNSWDDACVEMLYTLFDLCMVHAECTCDKDAYNEIGTLQMEKGIEMIRYAMEQSVTSPFANEKACMISAETIHILRCGERKVIRKLTFGNDDLLSSNI